MPAALARPGAFSEFAHPWRTLIRDPRINARRAAARAAAQAAAQTSQTPLASLPPAGAVSSAGGGAGGALGACIRAAEEGGSYAWGPGNGGGAYQFQEGTWESYGGNPRGSKTLAFGSADAADQDQIFENVVAAGPQAVYNAWESDGCPQQYGLDSVSATLIPLHHRHHHHVRDHARWLRWVMKKALAWARTQRGKPYCWGGTGPSCYDCSGLVMTAFDHEGFSLPRTAADMQNSPRLRQVRHPRPGDIVLYGWPAFHAALYAGHHRIFDALDSGTPVGSQPDTWPGQPIYYQLT